MVREMCKNAGITGHKTNHTLHATTATKLFHAGDDEQLIMERTGDRSMDGVCCYSKRTSQEQHEVFSDIVNLAIPGPAKKQKTQTAHSSEGSACSQNTQQMGLAPAQISLYIELQQHYIQYHIWPSMNYEHYHDYDH